jgi:CheY-like chemotaxis protein
MKGTVDLESELGKGTRIAVEVPFQKSLNPPSKLPRRPSQRSRRSTDSSLTAAATSPSALEPLQGRDGTISPMPAREADSYMAGGGLGQPRGRQPMAVAGSKASNIEIQMTMPSPPLSSPPMSVAPNGLTAPRSSYWILLAEDNPLNSEIFVKGLSRMGFSVLAVPNGLEAVQAMDKRPWDLVLMDGQMPICDGYEATRQIRGSSNSTIKDTTIIALTASAIAGDKERCLEAGMNGYLSKPVRLKVVSQAVSMVRCGSPLISPRTCSSSRLCCGTFMVKPLARHEDVERYLLL